MASAQSNSTFKANFSQQSKKLWGRTIDLGDKIVNLSEKIVTKSSEVASLINNNKKLVVAIATTGAIVTTPWSWPITQPKIAKVYTGIQATIGNAYNKINDHLNRAHQLEVLKHQQQVLKHQEEVLNHFFDKAKELREHATDPNDKNIRRLLKANSFTALRNLNEIGKGRLIRFLSEDELIKSNNPAIQLSGADLQKIDLENAWMPHINLNGTYIFNGNLKNVSFKRASLKGAHLNKADLTGADLTGADLTGADLRLANLSQAKGLSQAILNGACYSKADATKESTKFPTDFNPAKAKMIHNCPS